MVRVYVVYWSVPQIDANVHGSYVLVNRCLARKIDMWFGSSVVECRDSVPGQALYFFTTCYISARGPTHSPSNSRLPVIYFLFYDLVYFQTNQMVTW